MNKKKLFSNESSVRIDDLNYGSHLCHSKFINIIHNTRALFLKNNNLSEVDCNGVSLIMLNLNIEYKNQCFFNDILSVDLYLEEFSRAKVLFSYSIHNKTSMKLSSIASTLMAFYNTEKKKLTTAPPLLAEILLNNE